MNSQQETQSGQASIAVHPLLLQSPLCSQQVLFIEAHVDDAALLATGDAGWLEVVRGLDWRLYRPVAARYYQALWEFNTSAAGRRAQAEEETLPAWPEGERQATLRLMRQRPTEGQAGTAVLHPTPPLPVETPAVREELLEPGVVPFRMVGRAPKCFFALFNAFEALHLMGKGASAEEVHHHLQISPPFARACGFTIPDPKKGYRQSDIPSLRKLEQFDQIMSSRGLWADAVVRTVRDNIATGKVSLSGQRLAHDTTHYVAYSAMDVVEVPDDPAPEKQPSGQPTSPAASRVEQNGPAAQQKGAESALSAVTAESVQPANEPDPKPRRKSQSRTVKACRCADRETCPHPWELSDPGAATVVKGSQTGGKRMYWAHKAAVLATTPDGIPLDVVAVTDAATHDGKSLEPHLQRFFSTYPKLVGKFPELVADTAYDDEAAKKRIEEKHGLRVRTDVNPRTRKTRTQDLPRGMKSLSPAGTLTCQWDRPMTYLGMRYQEEEFLYGPPGLAKGHVACEDCPLRDTCCRRDAGRGRYASIPFTRLPHISVEDPPMARRFKASMRMRPVIERTIKRIKLDFGDDHLTRRGNDAFQAHLDRSLLAFHLALRAT